MSGVGRVQNDDTIIVFVQEVDHIVDGSFVALVAKSLGVDVVGIEPLCVFQATTHALSVFSDVEDFNRHGVEEGNVFRQTARDVSLATPRQATEAETELVLRDWENTQGDGVFEHMSNSRRSSWEIECSMR